MITNTDATTVVDAKTMPRADAERLDKRIRRMVADISGKMDTLYALVDKAKAGRVWEALDYPSWTAYAAEVLQVTWKINGEERRELVAFLSGEGMSQRAIADVVGSSVGTVNADLRGVQNRTPEAVDDVDGEVRSDAEWADVIEVNFATTGLDGKTYSRPEPKRRPKPDPDAPLMDCEQHNHMVLTLYALRQGRFTNLRKTAQTALIKIYEAELEGQPVGVIKDALTDFEETTR